MVNKTLEGPRKGKSDDFWNELDEDWNDFDDEDDNDEDNEGDWEEGVM